MIERTTAPTIRVRVNHDKTSKGWRCNETTCEITAVVGNGEWNIGAIQALMSAYMHAMHEDGLNEASRRNAVEGFGS